MLGLFRFVDPDDPTIVRFDMNTLGNDFGENGIGLLGDLDLGTVQVDSAFMGTEQTKANYDTVPQMRFRLWSNNTDLDDLLALASALNKELSRENCIEFRPEGATSSRYFDTFPSDLPNIFRGQDLALNKIVDHLIDPDGIPVVLNRQPYVRLSPLPDQVFTVGNAPGTRTLIIDNPGDLAAKMIMRITPNAGKLSEVKMARRSHGNLTYFQSANTFEVGPSGLFNSTAMVSEANTSGGDVAKTTFPTLTGDQKPPWRRRWRKVITVGNAKTIKGTHRVHFVVRTTDVDSTVQFQLRWANGDREPAAHSNKIVEFDTHGVDEQIWVEVDMGLVELKEDTVTFEGWARRIDGAADLKWDYVALFPTDERFMRAAAPGLFTPGAYVTRWQGGELEKYTGTPYYPDDVDLVRLNAVDDAVMNPGGVHTVEYGRHRVEVHCNMRNKNENEVVLGQIEVRDSGGAVVKSTKLRTRKRIHTKIRNKAVVFDADGATDYFFTVRMTADPTDADARISIEKFANHIQRYATSNDAFVFDGVLNEAYLELSDGKQVDDLNLQGDQLKLAPGNNLLMFSFGDIQGSGYDEIVYDQPLPKCDVSRTCTVTISVSPRYTA